MFMDDADLIEDMIRSSDGVEVTRGVERTWGHLDSPDASVFLDSLELRGAAHVCIVPTAKLTMQRDATYRVGSKSLKLADWLAIEDGAQTAMGLVAV